jgi:hypothetical protein
MEAPTSIQLKLPSLEQTPMYRDDIQLHHPNAVDDLSHRRYDGSIGHINNADIKDELPASIHDVSSVGSNDTIHPQWVV